MTAKAVREKVFTGWHFLALILAFFGVIIAVNVGLAVLAARTWTGVVVDDSYTSGNSFNDKVALAREQDALGWQSTLTYDGASVHLTLRDASGPLEIADVSARATRLIGDRDDATVPLTPQPDGSFTANLALRPGKWTILAVAATTPHGVYERRQDVVVP